MTQTLDPQLLASLSSFVGRVVSLHTPERPKPTQVRIDNFTIDTDVHDHQVLYFWGRYA